MNAVTFPVLKDAASLQSEAREKALGVCEFRYFLSVAQTGNLGRAARLLNVSQPAISLQLRKLEDGLGTQLLLRHSRGVTLTAAGACLRDRLHTGLTAKLSGVSVNGSPEHRLPNNLNVSFAGVDGESLMMGLSDVAVSSGSACTSANLEASYVLKALGVSDDLAHSSVRFGLGRFNTLEEVEYVIEKVTRVVSKLRELSPRSEATKEEGARVKWQTA